MKPFKCESCGKDLTLDELHGDLEGMEICWKCGDDLIEYENSKSIDEEIDRKLDKLSGLED